MHAKIDYIRTHHRSILTKVCLHAKQQQEIGASGHYPIFYYRKGTGDLSSHLSEWPSDLKINGTQGNVTFSVGHQQKVGNWPLYQYGGFQNRFL